MAKHGDEYEYDEERGVWEPRTPEEEAHIERYQGIARGLLLWFLAFLAVAFALWAISWMLSTRTADARSSEVAPALVGYGSEGEDGAVNPQRRPCWARSSPRTCTPTPAPSETSTPTHTSTSTPTYTAVVLPTDTATVVPSPSATNSPTATPTAINWSEASPEQFELETARLINLHRTEAPPHPEWWENGIALTFYGSLQMAQREWAVQMIGDPNDPADDGCYHGDFGARAARYGYTGWAWAEIGACGFPTPADAVQGWINSPAHHWAMDEAEAMTEFGVGAAQYGNGYWQVWAVIGCDGGIPCMAAREGLEQREMPAPVVGPGHGKGR